MGHAEALYRWEYGLIEEIIQLRLNEIGRDMTRLAKSSVSNNSFYDAAANLALRWVYRDRNRYPGLKKLHEVKLEVQKAFVIKKLREFRLRDSLLES